MGQTLNVFAAKTDWQPTVILWKIGFTESLVVRMPLRARSGGKLP